MQLCYFTPAKHLLENLQKKRLKISRFSDCNDVFELGSLRARRDQKKHQSKADRQGFRVWEEKQNDNLGLICFSRHHYSPLMWAHYADRNKGACLVFEPLEALHQSAPKHRLVPVRYTKTRNPFFGKLPDLNKPEAETEDCIQLAATKELDWAYEEEIRLLIDIATYEKTEEGLYFFNFEKHLKLKSIYLGPKCSKKDCEDMEQLGDIYPSSVKLKKKRSAFWEYKMVDDRSFGAKNYNASPQPRKHLPIHPCGLAEYQLSTPSWPPAGRHPRGALSLGRRGP